MMSKVSSLILVVLVTIFAFCASEECKSDEVKTYAEGAISRECERYLKEDLAKKADACYEEHGLPLGESVKKCGNPCKEADTTSEEATEQGCCIVENMKDASSKTVAEINDIESECFSVM